MITAPDDGWVRTHDDALDLLRAAASGARVRVSRISSQDRAAERARRYEVLLDRIGGSASQADLYSLPCLASPLTRRVMDLCASAALATGTQVVHTGTATP